MKKKLIAILAIALLVICTGCFGDPVKTDLESYLNFEMSAEKEAQDFSLDFVGNAYGATSKEEAQKIISDGAQKITEIADKQKGYKPKTKEVQDIHDKYIKVMDTTVDALNDLTKLMNSNKPPSTEQLNSIKKKQQDIIKITKEYRNDLNALAEQKKVEVKLNFK